MRLCDIKTMNYFINAANLENARKIYSTWFLNNVADLKLTAIDAFLKFD